MKKLLALLLALVMVMALVACGEKPQEEDPGKKDPEPPVVEYDTEADLVYGMTAKWNTMAYYSISPAAPNYVISEKIWDRLWYINEDGSAAARNAESWTWNSDFTELTIQLNKNAKWHDGQPVTAEDWVFTYELQTNPEVGYVKASNNKYLEGCDSKGFLEEGKTLGVTAKDTYTLVFNFKQNMISLQDLMSRTKMELNIVVPKHLLKDIPAAEVYTCSYWDNPVGSGPMKFVSGVINDEVKLESNKDYYLGAPQFKTLTFKYMDAATSLATWKTGTGIDMVWTRYNTDNAIEAMQYAQQGLCVAEMDNVMTRVVYLLFNNTTVSDKRIRKAIQYTLDRAALAKSIMSDTAVPTATYVTNENPNKKTDIDITPSLEKAEALLKECGITKDNPLTLKMDTVAGYRQSIAAYMQQELAKIGINLVVDTKDPATGFSEITAGTVDMAWIMDTCNNTDMHAAWYYQIQPNGYTQVTDTIYQTKMDEITALQAGSDKDALKKAMYDWQDFIYDEAVIVPLFFIHGVGVRSNRLEGARLHDTSGFNDNVCDWKVIKK